MDRNKVIFIGVIIFVILLLVIYAVFAFGSKNNNSTGKMVAPKMVKSDIKDAYNSRLAKAKDHMVPKEKQKPLDSRVNFEAYGEKDSTELSIEGRQEEITPTVNQAKETKNTTQQVNSGTITKTKVVYVKKKEPEENEAPKKEKRLNQDNTPTNKDNTETETNNSGGFGIVINNNIKKEESKITNDQGQNIISAYLEENIKVKDGTSLVFILAQESEIDGITLNKNAILFGKASDTGNIFDIAITQIKNTDGKLHAIKNLYVYNERFSRGIIHTKGIDQAVKEGSNTAVNSNSSNLYSGGTITGTMAEKGVNVAVNTVENTIKNLSKTKENSISLYKGYKVYLKKN